MKYILYVLFFAGLSVLIVCVAMFFDDRIHQINYIVSTEYKIVNEVGLKILAQESCAVQSKEILLQWNGFKSRVCCEGHCTDYYQDWTIHGTVQK